MLLQSSDGKIRVFPAIPSDWKDCRFVNLRAVGAFLVSSEVKEGKISYIFIESLKGGRCNVINPFDGEVEVVKSGKKISGINIINREINFPTEAGKSYFIKRGGEKTKQRFLFDSKKMQKLREYRGPPVFSQD